MRGAKGKNKADGHREFFGAEVIACPSGPSEEEQARVYADLLNSPEVAAYHHWHDAALAANHRQKPYTGLV